MPPAILAGHAGTDATTLRGGTPLAGSSGGQSQRSARLQLSAGRYITGPLGAVGTHTLTPALGDTWTLGDGRTLDARLGRRWSIGDSEERSKSSRGAIEDPAEERSEQRRSDRGAGGAIDR